MAVDPQTKPHSLTHISNLSWDDDNQLIVNEIVGVDPNGVVRKVPVGTDGSLQTSSNSLPTTGNNPSIEYDYTDPASIVLTQTIGSDTYQQTITISGTVATEGAWIKL